MTAGIAFPILVAVGASLVLNDTPDTPDKSASNRGALYAQGWLKLIDDKGNRVKIIVGCALLIVAALALIWFAAALRERFATRPGNPMFAFAVVGAVALIGAIAGPLAVTGGRSFGSDPAPADGTVIWFVFSTIFPFLLVGFGFAATAFIAALLLTTRGSLPTWLVAFGWLAAVAGVLGVLFLPLILLLLWFLALAIYGLVRAPAAASTAAA
jgi:hypothetical protein